VHQSQATPETTCHVSEDNAEVDSVRTEREGVGRFECGDVCCNLSAL
jgi:hypothetical protein